MKQNDLNFLCLALGGPEDTKKLPELAHAHTLDVAIAGAVNVQEIQVEKEL